jgi:hypothetical protein
MVMKGLKYLAGSTLVETMAAMVIITVSMIAGFMIYDQVVRAKNVAQRIQAKAIVTGVLNKDFDVMMLGEEVSKHGVLEVLETRSVYEPNVYKLKVDVRDEQRNTIYSESKLIMKYEK